MCELNPLSDQREVNALLRELTPVTQLDLRNFSLNLWPDTYKPMRKRIGHACDV